MKYIKTFEQKQKDVELEEARNFYIGTIYEWGDYEQGWMGKIVVVDIDKKFVYLSNVYKEKDIVFIKDRVKPIEDGWFIDTQEPTKETHREFERRLKKIYKFVEKIKI